CVSGALLIAGRESSTVSFVACSVSVCFSVSVGLIEPACFPVPVFGGLGGNELNCSVNSQRNREVLIGGWRDWRCGSPRPVQQRHPR
ncbi:MAG: hypothetical protein WA703_12545, partial [Pseudolabrys sp.]